MGKITLYTREGCPDCDKAKEVLEVLDLSFLELEFREGEEQEEHQLHDATGTIVPPLLYFDDELIEDGVNALMDKIQQQSEVLADNSPSNKNNDDDPSEYHDDVDDTGKAAAEPLSSLSLPPPPPLTSERTGEQERKEGYQWQLPRRQETETTTYKDHQKTTEGNVLVLASYVNEEMEKRLQSCQHKVKEELREEFQGEVDTLKETITELKFVIATLKVSQTKTLQELKEQQQKDQRKRREILRALLQQEEVEEDGDEESMGTSWSHNPSVGDDGDFLHPTKQGKRSSSLNIAVARRDSTTDTDAQLKTTRVTRRDSVRRSIHNKKNDTSSSPNPTTRGRGRGGGSSPQRQPSPPPPDSATASPKWSPVNISRPSLSRRDIFQKKLSYERHSFHEKMLLQGGKKKSSADSSTPANSKNHKNDNDKKPVMSSLKRALLLQQAKDSTEAEVASSPAPGNQQCCAKEKEKEKEERIQQKGELSVTSNRRQNFQSNLSYDRHSYHGIDLRTRMSHLRSGSSPSRKSTGGIAQNKDGQECGEMLRSTVTAMVAFNRFGKLVSPKKAKKVKPFIAASPSREASPQRKPHPIVSPGEEEGRNVVSSTPPGNQQELKEKPQEEQEGPVTSDRRKSFRRKTSHHRHSYDGNELGSRMLQWERGSSHPSDLADKNNNQSFRGDFIRSGRPNNEQASLGSNSPNPSRTGRSSLEKWRSLPSIPVLEDGLLSDGQQKNVQWSQQEDFNRSASSASSGACLSVASFPSDIPTFDDESSALGENMVELPLGNLVPVRTAIEELISILPTADLKYNRTIYRNSIKGTSLADTFQQVYLYSRKEAVELGKYLYKAKILHHVCDDQSYKDAGAFYRLHCHQTPEVLNSFCVWIDKSTLSKHYSEVIEDVMTKLQIIMDTLTDEKKVHYGRAAVACGDLLQELDYAVCELQMLKLARLAQKDLLAVGLNVYQLFLHYAFIKHGIPPSSSSSALSSFWINMKFNVGGDLFSFHEWWNGICRGNRMGPYGSKPFKAKDKDPRSFLKLPESVDPRIHFAAGMTHFLRPMYIYKGEYIDKELDRIAEMFCKKREFVSLNKSTSTLTLSQVFHDYTSDFPSTTNGVPTLVFRSLPEEDQAHLDEMLMSNKKLRVEFADETWDDYAGQHVQFKSAPEADIKTLLVSLTSAGVDLGMQSALTRVKKRLEENPGNC